MERDNQTGYRGWGRGWVPDGVPHIPLLTGSPPTLRHSREQQQPWIGSTLTAGQQQGQGGRAQAGGEDRGVRMHRGGGGVGCSRRAAVRLEPTPHRGSGYTVYISLLLRVQILTVKIGKTDLYLLLFSLMLCFLNAMGFNWCIIVWWFNLAGALSASRGWFLPAATGFSS